MASCGETLRGESRWGDLKFKLLPRILSLAKQNPDEQVEQARDWAGLAKRRGVVADRYLKKGWERISQDIKSSEGQCH